MHRFIKDILYLKNGIRENAFVCPNGKEIVIGSQKISEIYSKPYTKILNKRSTYNTEWTLNERT